MATTTAKSDTKKAATKAAPKAAAKSEPKKSTTSAAKSTADNATTKTAAKSDSKKSATSASKSSADKGETKAASKTGSKTASKTASKSSAKKDSDSDSKSNTTTDHEEIRAWVEQRGGKPAMVKGTNKKKSEAGILRIDFPGYTGKDTLEEIGWDEFFEKFDEGDLQFLYQSETADGKESRFNKFISK